MSTVVAFLIGMLIGAFCGIICMSVIIVGNKGESDE